MSNRLHNGIELADNWPPTDIDLTQSQPMRAPYLERRPAVLDISLGRQLFVDDFLVDYTNMDRRFGKPVKYPGNPVFFPQTHDECDAGFPPCAIAKSGGVWYDSADGLFKMCDIWGQYTIYWSKTILNVLSPDILWFVSNCAVNIKKYIRINKKQLIRGTKIMYG